MIKLSKQGIFCIAVALASIVSVAPAWADDALTISIMVGGISKFI